MANENTSKTRKPTPPHNTGSAASTPVPPAATPTTSSNGTATSSSSRKKDRSNRPQIGGTAAAGAKSTLPRQVPQTSDPNKQQMESYNRVMRRRMEHIGVGSQAQENRLEKARNRRQKRVAHAKERRVEAQQEMKKSLHDSGFGRKNLYLFLATLAVIVILIVIFVVLHQLHVM